MNRICLVMTLALVSVHAGAQTTYYSNQNGMPVGQAQQVGNTTYYTNQNGMPVGQAQTPITSMQPTAPLSPKAPLSPPNMFNHQ